MSLDWIKKVWEMINGINSTVKTVIILLLFILLGYPYLIHQNNELLLDYMKKIERLEIEDENYTLKMAPYINLCLYNILKGDRDCFNVLLLNYHNSLKSLQGFRYLYLNCITESPKGIEDKSLKLFWNNIEYIYYEDELTRIRNAGYLRVEDVDSIKTSFPKLYRNLVVCDARAAAFYPIEGIDSPVGMVIVLYKSPKTYSLGYYNTNVAPWILKLSTILDYQNVKTLISK